MNVIKELPAKSTLNGYVIENNERESIKVLHFTEKIQREQILEMTRTFAEEIKDALNKYLSFSVSNGIGGIYKEIKRLPDCYREAESALQYRIFNDTQATLFFDELEPSEKKSLFFYPREQEKVIIDALSRGELIYAESGLNQFAKTLRDSGSYNTIYQCYHVLLSSIIQSLEEQGPGMIDSLEGNWFDQLKARQTAREIYEWYMANPAVTAPIIGARNMEQLQPRLAALDVPMGPERRQEISAMSITPPPATDRSEGVKESPSNQNRQGKGRYRSMPIFGCSLYGSIIEPSTKA